jgi:hypothetical protein
MHGETRATNVVSSERLATAVTGGSDACGFFQFSGGRSGKR